MVLTSTDVTQVHLYSEKCGFICYTDIGKHYLLVVGLTYFKKEECTLFASPFTVH